MYYELQFIFFSPQAILEMQILATGFTYKSLGLCLFYTLIKN